MNFLPALRSPRRAAAATVLAVGLLSIPIATATTFAHAGPCRSDPVIFLTNGNTIDLTATVNDTQSNIQQVAYTVHIPVGSQVTKIQYTQGFRNKESVVTYADNSPGVYDTYTDATTADTPVNVSTSGVVVYKNGTKSQMASTSGFDNQQLHLHLSS